MSFIGRLRPAASLWLPLKREMYALKVSVSLSVRLKSKRGLYWLPLLVLGRAMLRELHVGDAVKPAALQVAEGDVLSGRSGGRADVEPPATC